MSYLRNQILDTLRQQFKESFKKENKLSPAKWSEHNNPDAIKFFQQVFTEGMCVNFQLAALSHLQDWKQYVLFFGESEYEFEQHVALKHPTEDVFFDALGLRSLDDLLATYDAQNAKYIWHDEAELCSSYHVDEKIMEDIALYFINIFKVREYIPSRGVCLHDDLEMSFG